MANRFILNERSYHGKGAIQEIAGEVTSRGLKKALLCTDPDLLKFGVTKKVTDVLDAAGLEYNKPVAGKRYRAIGKAMQVPGIDNMTDEEAADATIAAVKQLSLDVGIPQSLNGILKEEDVAFLSQSAYADACCPGNPRDTSEEEIAQLYRSLL